MFTWLWTPLSALLLYALTIALLPLLALPYAGVDVSLQKSLFAAGGLGIALIALVHAYFYWSRRPSLVPPALGWVGLAFAAAALISFWVSDASLQSVFGTGFEIGTVGSLLLYALALLAGSMLQRAQLWLCVRLLTAMAALSTLVCSIVALNGADSSFAPMAWPAIAFMSVASLACAALIADSSNRSTRLYWWGAAALLFFLNIVVFHPVASLLGGALLLACAMPLAMIAFKNRTPWPITAPIVGFLLVLMSSLGFAPLAAMQLDARLTLTATQIAGSPVYMGTVQGLLFGSGPDTFASVWELNRPMEFNQTPLWNLTFSEGFSTLVTWFIELGFIGTSVYFLGYAWLAVSLCRRKTERAWPDPLLYCCAFLAFFSFCAAALYTIDMPLLLIGGLAFGGCASVLRTRENVLTEPRLVTRLAACLIFFLLGSGLLYVSARQAIAAFNHERGIKTFMAQNFYLADTLLESAAKQWPSSFYLRDASRASFETTKLQAQSGEVDAEVLQKRIGRVQALALASVNRDPQDYAAWLSRGSLITELVAAGLVDLAPEASSSLFQAHKRSPLRPEIAYVQARLAQAQGDLVSARFFVAESLRRKPDYQPALELFASFQTP